MFRVANAFAIALVASLLSLGDTAAHAGSKYSHHSISARHGSHVRAFQAQRLRKTNALPGRYHAPSPGYAFHDGWHRHPAASSGVMLGHYGSGQRMFAGDHHRLGYGGGPKIIRFGAQGRKWHDRQGGDRIAIVVGTVAGADAAAGDARLDARTRLEGGSCAPGLYCTVRLGPYASSPKIITLNTSGRTISEDTLE